jgi:hypothetical protein
MPSKRRTIQGPPTNPTSSISSFQKPVAPVIAYPQAIISNNDFDHEEHLPTSLNAGLPQPPAAPPVEADRDVQREDEMQQLVAYINQFEKENISSAANAVQNDAYIEMTPSQLEKLKSNQQEAETIHLGN